MNVSGGEWQNSSLINFMRCVLGALTGHVVASSNFYSEIECGLKCVTMEGDCKSLNYIQEPNQTTKCEINNMTQHSAPKTDFIQQQYSKYLEPINIEQVYMQLPTRRLFPCCILVATSNVISSLYYRCFTNVKSTSINQRCFHIELTLIV